MKIAAISDMHGFLPSLKEMPEADVLCICGDTFPLKMQRNPGQSRKWFRTVFKDWVEALPVEQVVMIAGNHDFAFEVLDRQTGIALEDFRNDIPTVSYLCNSQVEIGGVTFYGFPWTPVLESWAYYVTDEEMARELKKVPTNVDVFLTHCPPKVGTQGVVLEMNNWNYLKNFGSQQIFDKVFESNFKWVLSGHIHSGNHVVEEEGGTKFVNVSYLNENYGPTYKVFTFEI